MIKGPSLRAVVTFMIPIIVLYGLYIQFHGDYSPGGGFQAGVIIASAIILYGILFGPSVTFKVMPLSIVKLIGALGVLVYLGTGLFGMLLDKEFLNYSVLAADSVLGQKIGIFVVELGVGMTVCSSMIIIYFNFASRKK